MNNELVEWQIIDQSNGLVFPWFTHGMLHELRTWDLKETVVLETGAGRSTAWWRKECPWVDTLEANDMWAHDAAYDCSSKGLTNGQIHFKQINDGVEGGWDKYRALIPKIMSYDMIIVDGIYRTEMMFWAVDHLEKNNGGILIADNWQQDFVWVSPAAEEAVAAYNIHRYPQEGHTNHEGRCWNTSYWIINKK